MSAALRCAVLCCCVALRGLLCCFYSALQACAACANCQQFIWRSCLHNPQELVRSMRHTTHQACSSNLHSQFNHAFLCIAVIMADSAAGSLHNTLFVFFRGYKGRVVSSTDSDVRMELEAQYKTVTVKRGQLTGQESSAVPSGFGRPKANVPPWQMSSGRTPLHAGAATPLHGSATPLHPSAPPMHPSATPMHPGKLTPRTLLQLAHSAKPF